MGGAGIGSEGGGNGSGCGVGNGAGLGRGSGFGGDGLGSGIMFFMSSCLQWARWIERQVQTHRRAGRTGFATLRCVQLLGACLVVVQPLHRDLDAPEVILDTVRRHVPPIVGGCNR